jgi:hypothetical protein
LVTLEIVSTPEHQNYQLRIQALLPNQPASQLTPGPVTSWKTCLDEDFSFKIGYPSTNIPEIFPDNGTYLRFVSFGNPPNQNKIWFSVKVTNNSLANQVHIFCSQTESHVLVGQVKKADIKFRDHSGIKLEYKFLKPDGSLPKALPIVNNGAYTYTISPHSENIDQALSSFEFLDEPPPRPKQPWRTTQ